MNYADVLDHVVRERGKLEEGVWLTLKDGVRIYYSVNWGANGDWVAALGVKQNSSLNYFIIDFAPQSRCEVKALFFDNGHRTFLCPDVAALDLVNSELLDKWLPDWQGIVAAKNPKRVGNHVVVGPCPPHVSNEAIESVVADALLDALLDGQLGEDT